MSIWSVLNACLASVALYVALHYFIHYAVRSRALSPLLFSLGCFGAALYDLAGAGLYSQTDSASALPWSRFQHVAFSLLVLFLLWWVVAISAKAVRWWDRALGGFFLLYALAVVTYPGSRLWIQAPYAKEGSFFGIAPITYHEMRGTFPTDLVQYVAMAVALYALVIFWRYVLPRRPDFAKPLMAAIAVISVAGINDIGIASRWWKSVYLTEFSFTFLLVAMAFQIAREQTRWEEALATSLREKDILLKEIHHRVKNNMQIISGMLALNEKVTRDESARALFRDSHSRVASMALIHEHLYSSASLSCLDFARYLEELLQNLKTALLPEGGEVGIRLHADSAEMVIDTALPCGLLVNELVTNALKHAFPGRRAGNVEVTFRKQEGGFYELAVSDDGVGLPPGSDISSMPSLGMRMVTILAQQLGAQMRVGRAGGTSFAFTFREYSEAGTTLY